MLIRNARINVQVNNNKMIFEENCDINGLRILILGDKNIIKIGKSLIINASSSQPTIINAVGGTKIRKLSNFMCK